MTAILSSRRLGGVEPRARQTLDRTATSATGAWTRAPATDENSRRALHRNVRRLHHRIKGESRRSTMLWPAQRHQPQPVPRSCQLTKNPARAQGSPTEKWAAQAGGGDRRGADKLIAADLF